MLTAIVATAARNRPPATHEVREHDEAGSECEQRRARERVQERNGDQRAQWNKQAEALTQRSGEQQGNDEAVRARKRTKED